MRKKIFQGIIVRQKRPYRRVDGVWVQFEDNAAVIITPEGEMKGSEIRGPVAKEAAERWPRIASAASIIV
jgi:large subunit ribosomal protein L14